jgi:HSP20 family protein
MNGLTIYNPLELVRPSRWLWDRFFTPSIFGELVEEERVMSPRVDVTENEKEYTIKADLPGFKDEGINLEVKDGRLTLTARREEEKEEEKENFRLRERVSGSYERTFGLPEDVDTEHIGAKMDKGVLTVTLPKKEESKPKKIEIH